MKNYIKALCKNGFGWDDELKKTTKNMLIMKR